MRNIKLLLAYDGTNYHGFQRQENAISVQAVLEQALGKICREPIRLATAGRTDTGVHARGQVVSFHTMAPIPQERFPYAINCCLPADIVVLAAEEMPAEFHPRRSARAKTYRYTLDTGKFPDVFQQRFAWHPMYSLKRELLVQASSYLCGTHDFAAFRAAGSAVRTSVRTITRAEWDFVDDPLWHFYITGNGFLYKMVRLIVGTLVEVARGKIPPQSIKELLGCQQSQYRAGPTAPAKGLTLWEVIY
jgi:tRNA pseudouridine38-40 synthase